jgi:hypothetical protein
MGRDEQVEEREVLDSIFPKEITGALGIMWGEDNAHDFKISPTHPSESP